MNPDVDDPDIACGRDVLEALAAHSDAGGATIAELVGATGRHRSVLTRLVADLGDLGLVVRDPLTLRIRLGWTWYVLATQVTQHRLLGRGQIALDGLADEVGETAYLVVREGRSAVTRAESIPAHRSIQVASWVGRSWPIARSDAGPTLLADVARHELAGAIGRGALGRVGAAAHAPRTIAEFAVLVEQVRRLGYSVLDEQTEIGVASVAAPVRDFTGRLVAALVISGPSQRMRPQLDRLAVHVAGVAGELTRDLGADRTTGPTDG